MMPVLATGTIDILEVSPLVLSLRLEGEFDGAGEEGLRQLLLRAGSGDPSEVQLQCVEVSFCDSTFLREIVDFKKRLTAKGARCVIASSSHAMRRAVCWAGLAELLFDL